MLISNLRQVAPLAAEVLANSYRTARYDQWEAVLAAIADGGPLPLATAGAEAEVFDPFAHWVLAMEGERSGGNAETLAESLFHYAYAERLFQTARFRTPEQIVKRRIALARSLSDDVVYDVFQRLAGLAGQPRRCYQRSTARCSRRSTMFANGWSASAASTRRPPSSSTS